MSHNIAPSIGNRYYPQGHVAESESPCKRGCCWSPYGHSSAARDCHCHATPTETRGINRSGDVRVRVGQSDDGNKLGPQTGAERLEQGNE